MKSIYKKIEIWFEQFTELVLKVFGNSITFIIAVLLVIAYLSTEKLLTLSFHNIIYDLILCITFLSLFIIQKAFNKYNTVIHLKMNELVATHDKASNRMINIEQKTEEELKEMAKYYADLAEKVEQTGEMLSSSSIEAIIEEQKEKEQKT